MNIEILLCIDCTGSMGETIKSVKENAVNFIKNVKEKFPQEKYQIDRYRVRIVEFRDIENDKDNSIVGSKFFDLNKNEEQFYEFLYSLEANGGSNEDPEEDGLEGLAYGLLTTEWTFDPSDIQIIALWTDVSSHKFEYNQKKDLLHYPKGMPISLTEFSTYWNTKFLKKAPNANLLIFAPNLYPWKQINLRWANTNHISTVLGKPTGILQDIFSDFSSNYLGVEEDNSSIKQKIINFIRLPFANKKGFLKTASRKQWARYKIPITVLSFGWAFIKVFSFAIFSITLQPTFNFYFDWSEDYSSVVIEKVDNYRDQGSLSEETDVRFYTELEKNIGWWCSSYDLILVYEIDYEIPNYKLGEYSIQELRETSIGASIITDHLNELNKYFEFDNLITVNVIGETDAAPIKSSITYNGQFGDLYGKLFLQESNKHVFDMVKGDTIQNNTQLGFLRGYGLWNHMKRYSDVFIGGKTDLRFTVENNSGYGSKYRKSIIQIKFYDIEEK